MEVPGLISRNLSMNPKRITIMSESTVLTITFVLPLMTASVACSSNLLSASSYDGAAPLTTINRSSQTIPPILSCILCPLVMAKSFVQHQLFMMSVDVNALLISDLNCPFVSAPVRFSGSLLSNLKLTRELEPCVFLVKPLIGRLLLKLFTSPISSALNLLAVFETPLSMLKSHSLKVRCNSLPFRGRSHIT